MSLRALIFKIQRDPILSVKKVDDQAPQVVIMQVTSDPPLCIKCSKYNNISLHKFQEITCSVKPGEALFSCPVRLVSRHE